MPSITFYTTYTSPTAYRYLLSFSRRRWSDDTNWIPHSITAMHQSIKFNPQCMRSIGCRDAINIFFPRINFRIFLSRFHSINSCNFRSNWKDSNGNNNGNWWRWKAVMMMTNFSGMVLLLLFLMESENVLSKQKGQSDRKEPTRDLAEIQCN